MKVNGVRVGRSLITGKGLFATKAYKRDDILCEYKGKVVPLERVTPNRYLVEVDDEVVIDGSRMSNIGRWANHSCRPNAALELLVKAKRARIYALKRIKPGDEITLNYGPEYVETYLKQCKCPKCQEVSYARSSRRIAHQKSRQNVQISSQRDRRVAPASRRRSAQGR